MVSNLAKNWSRPILKFEYFFIVGFFFFFFFGGGGGISYIIQQQNRNKSKIDVRFLLLLLEVHRNKQIQNPTKTEGEVSIQKINNK